MVNTLFIQITGKNMPKTLYLQAQNNYLKNHRNKFTQTKMSMILVHHNLKIKCLDRLAVFELSLNQTFYGLHVKVSID